MWALRNLSACCHFGIRRLLGPTLSSLAVFLICFVMHTFLFMVLPLIAEPSQLVPTTTVAGFIFCNILYNYFKASFMDPGCPPEYAAEVARAAELGESPPKKCAKCDRAKPQRAHHCSTCRRCILKMDHHCPWINNCVGFDNYRYFCLFLIYLTAGCASVVFVFGPFALASSSRSSDEAMDEQSLANLRSRMWRMNGGKALSLIFRCTLDEVEGPSCIIMSFMLCLVVLVMLTFLGGTHVVLVVSNYTTIEAMGLVRERRARCWPRNFEVESLGCRPCAQFPAGLRPKCLLERSVAASVHCAAA
mmetsp:Transcript_52908/g.141388  ORF Transcript_52908/g.141388 Transcript_52908/m.141388 type:complete len:304 (-) Transcript_52908:201-1112(-)